MNIDLLKQYKPFATEHHRYKAVYGGRGKGATWQIARILLLKAMESPIRVLCTREYQNSINESVYYTLKNQIELMELPNFHVMNTEIRHENGSQFIFKGLRHNINSIKSTEGIKYCWVAEGDKVPQDSWDKLIPTIREPQSEIWVDWNTDSKADPAYRMFVENKPEDAIVLFQTYADNPYFPEVLKEEMEYCRKTDYEKYLWIWKGHIREISEACVFKGKFRVDDFKTPDDAEFYHGVDWGFANDPLAIIRSFSKNDTLYIDREAGGVGIEIDQTAKVFDEIPTMRKWRSYADNARPEIVKYMKTHGFPNIQSCKKGKGSIEDGIAKIRAFKEVVIHPSCKNTIEEFKLYKYKQNSTTGDIMPVPEDKNNHWIDALRYSLEKYGKKKIASPSNINLGALGL